MRALLLSALVLAGCASNSGIVPMGQGQYLVTRQAATGFSGMGTLRADAVKEASDFCSGMNKDLNVTRTTTPNGPYVLGNFPRADVEFTCESK